MSETPSKTKNANFLHSHPETEKLLGVDERHIIVDRKDYEAARSYFQEQGFFPVCPVSKEPKVTKKSYFVSGLVSDVSGEFRMPFPIFIMEFDQDETPKNCLLLAEKEVKERFEGTTIITTFKEIK